jgi:hypothetical protein
MRLDELTIGEAKQLAAMLGGGEDGFRPAREGELVIAVLQRGWVFVGEYSQKGSTATLSNAKCVRRWGTTKGLGELAMGGPLENTMLDDSPPVKFHVREAVMIMEANKDAWRK